MKKNATASVVQAHQNRIKRIRAKAYKIQDRAGQLRVKGHRLSGKARQRAFDKATELDRKADDVLEGVTRERDKFWDKYGYSDR